MIKRIILYALLYTLGYFALFAGNVCAANVLGFVIICLSTIILILFVFKTLYEWAEDNPDLTPTQKDNISNHLSIYRSIIELSLVHSK